MKPGYKTTEFWLTLAALFLGALVAFGILTPGEGETAETAVSQAIEAIAGAVIALAPLWRYIGARTKLKERYGR